MSTNFRAAYGVSAVNVTVDLSPEFPVKKAPMFRDSSNCCRS